MLVLRQSLHEAIVIHTPTGDTIELVLVRGGRRPQVGITAPDDYEIVRQRGESEMPAKGEGT